MRRLASTASLLGLFALSSATGLRAAEGRRFELSVVVDGVPLPEYAWRDRVYIEALRGHSFSLRISNPTSARMAVAISVDGRNVVDAKRTSAGQAAKWVLSPGETIEIPGWQVSGETARRFFFTETDRSYAKWLGDTLNVGAIEAVFFRERTRRSQPITVLPPALGRDIDREPSAGSGSEPLGSVEGGVPSRPEAQKRTEAAPEPNGLTERRGAAKPQPKDSDGYAATGIGERTSFAVRWVDFDLDPEPVARIALRYEFRRELVRLGVLPRGDELYARERARGFEPEYAPDPSRHR